MMKPSIYEPFPAYPITKRAWPDNRIEKAPTWCSVDLSEGTQVLPYPISEEKKWQLFQLLLQIGIKQIEIGMPGQCQSAFMFARRLIEKEHTQEDAVIQVMSKMKHKSIEHCLKAVEGAKAVVFHLFHSASTLGRDAIYDGQDEQHMISRVVDSLLYARDKAQDYPDTQFQFQYSPEGFNTTEPERLMKLCQAAIEVMQPTEEAPLIINFFEAVEADSPNRFADRIEYIIEGLGEMPHVTYSVRTHNDRGTAVASSELAMLAGVSRIEGSMLGAGARAGTASLLTIALNLYTQGVMPALNLNDVDEIVATFEECLGERVAKHFPYVGENAFTAYSAHEQFSIHEALQSFDEEKSACWDVPYLPMNPKDIGRDNDAVIRLNHLSGRTGIAHVMKKHHGFCLPYALQKEFSLLVKHQVQTQKIEFDLDALYTFFTETYIRQTEPLSLRSIAFDKMKKQGGWLQCEGKLDFWGETVKFTGEGQGALHTMLNGLKDIFSLEMEIDEYFQHALGHSAVSQAASYVRLRNEKDVFIWGVAVDNDATLANIRALISAINRTMDMTND